MKTSRLCLAMLAGLVPTFIAHSETRTQNNIPALLQFAEQYQQNTPEKDPQLEAEPATRPSSWQIKDAEPQRLRVTIAELKLQLLQAKRQATESDNALASLRNNSERQITQLQTSLAAIQSRSPQQVSAEQLKTAKNRQDYAAGVSLGEEILQMQAERARWGVKTDKQLILAGITDTFAGELSLANDVLNSALASAEKEVNVARDKTLASQTKTGGSYLAKFKQDPQVKQASSGFWYKIDYAGDTALSTGASVDVVVKEMLADGTVIQDMEASGASLSQPIEDFPPLFKEAISLLRNHGSMTLVVPPEQAYGEKGYPPKVPPNATMVYQLRIAEMYPAGKPKTTTAAN